ncbi:MAG: hypothetical protein H7Z75_09865 [Ferruginibacter sp.]|nr:hypothetical protein [Cytophagales bacterium]
MKKLNSLLLAFAFLGVLQLAGCKKKDDPKPASELIVKNWKVKEAKEDGTKVYDDPYAAGSDTKDYSRFKLEFTSATDVRLTEQNGDVITGKWTLTESDKKLVLSGLTPQPTGVTGNLEYTNVVVTDSELRFTRSSPNPKTGASSTEYVLFF